MDAGDPAACPFYLATEETDGMLDAVIHPEIRSLAEALEAADAVAGETGRSIYVYQDVDPPRMPEGLSRARQGEWKARPPRGRLRLMVVREPRNRT